MAAEGAPGRPDVHAERSDRAGGVEDAFSTIVSLAVDTVLARGRQNRTGRLFRQRILLFIAGREYGASKNELFAEFKNVVPALIMDELDNLVRLDALALDEAGAKTFVKAADVPGTERYRATERGRRIAESPKGEELAIEEIV
jgi:hypothetical protein